MSLACTAVAGMQHQASDHHSYQPHAAQASAALHMLSKLITAHAVPASVTTHLLKAAALHRNLSAQAAAVIFAQPDIFMTQDLAGILSHTAVQLQHGFSRAMRALSAGGTCRLILMLANLQVQLWHQVDSNITLQTLRCCKEEQRAP